MKKFRVEEAVFQIFPDLQIAVLPFYGVNNEGVGREDLLKKACRQLFERMKEEENLHPHIQEYKEAMKKVKRKKGSLASLEAMAKRILKGETLSSINPVVDLYNCISLGELFTCGGEDLDQIQGEMILGFAKGDEEFIPLGEAENSSPREGELIYKDHKGAVVRSWLWREADRTKITRNSANVLIYMENINTNREEEFQKAAYKLQQKMEKETGGRGSINILSRKNPWGEI